MDKAFLVILLEPPKCPKIKFEVLKNGIWESTFENIYLKKKNIKPSMIEHDRF